MIEQFIEQRWGTSIGNDVKNMYENGTNYDSICDKIDMDTEDFI